MNPSGQQGGLGERDGAEGGLRLAHTALPSQQARQREVRVAVLGRQAQRAPQVADRPGHVGSGAWGCPLGRVPARSGSTQRGAVEPGKLRPRREAAGEGECGARLPVAAAQREHAALLGHEATDVLLAARGASGAHLLHGRGQLRPRLIRPRGGEEGVRPLLHRGPAPSPGIGHHRRAVVVEGPVAPRALRR